MNGRHHLSRSRTIVFQCCQLACGRGVLLYILRVYMVVPFPGSTSHKESLGTLKRFLDHAHHHVTVYTFSCIIKNQCQCPQIHSSRARDGSWKNETTSAIVTVSISHDCPTVLSCDCHMTVQAEEEFNIEKGRLLQNEKRKVATYFERREKQLELQRKM